MGGGAVEQADEDDGGGGRGSAGTWIGMADGNWVEGAGSSPPLIFPEAGEDGVTGDRVRKGLGFLDDAQDEEKVASVMAQWIQTLI